MGGQGTPFDEQAKRRYAAVLRKRPGRQAAAAELGFTWGTVRKHLKNDPAFLEMVEEAEMSMVEAAESVLWDMAMDEHFPALQMILHNLNPSKWKQQQILRHEHTGVAGGPIQIAAGITLGLSNALTNPELRGDVLSGLADFPTTEQLDAETVDAELLDDDD